ncbi:MAG TPA: alpha/beta hydrolase-fold protein [Thermoanaerobaculia bacterium]|nr:alpha/beta hydrolase-fold protein [Thermoanaerobaculia bacterium]
MEHITRRRFIGWSMAGAAAAVSGLAGSGLFAADAGAARFKARPGKPTKPAQIGLHDLGLAQGKDGVISVPPGYTPDKPVPLIFFLHGALGRFEGYNVFAKMAADQGIAMVIPDARNGTWDLVQGGFGPDIAFLERALAYTFDHVAIDPRRVALSGFSDGGSYALSVGLANGDLFTHVMAFSPGFMAPPSRTGKPHVFLAHGRQDEILPISGSRDGIVPQLKQWGYDVTYREFDGPHGLNLRLAPDVFQWMLR